MSCDHKRTCPVHNRRAAKRIKDSVDAARAYGGRMFLANLMVSLVTKHGVDPIMASKVLLP